MSRLDETKERPILFSGDMVRAILDGRKTQTRRVIKGATDWPNAVMTQSGCCWATPDGQRYPENGLIACPYGSPGDRLWVRETWSPVSPWAPSPDTGAFYRADYLDDPHGPDGEKSPEGKYRTWKPSIHMPRWASRLTLEVTDVRVERVQDISEQDSEAEGCRAESRDNNGNCWETPASYFFHRLWDSINAKRGYGWDANPWVWVVEFKRAEEP